MIEEGTGGELTFTDRSNRNTADIHTACVETLGVTFKTQKKRGRKPKAVPAVQAA